MPTLFVATHLFFLFYFLPLQGTSDSSSFAISFSMISQDDPSLIELSQKKISIRGFPYRTPSGSWVLASQPNLKSCCIGSSLKQNEQIHLIGTIPDELSSSAVTLTGKLEIAQTKESLYRLKDPSIISQQKISLKLPIFILIALIISFLLLRKTPFLQSDGVSKKV